MARGRQFPARRRMLIWSNVLPRMEFQGLGTGETLGSVSVGAQTSGGVTHIRTRGNAFVRLVAGAASDSQLVGIGIGITDVDAFTAGSASLPGPLTDPDEDWLWHHLFPMGPAVGAEAQTDQGTFMFVEIDSKAKRILKPGDVIYLKAEGIITAGAPTADGFAAIRNLSMLS